MPITVALSDLVVVNPKAEELKNKRIEE
jgi:hypothetical protein